MRPDPWETYQRNTRPTGRTKALGRALILTYNKPDNLEWFVLQVWDDLEFEVERKLEAAGIEAWVPTKAGKVRKNRGRRRPRDCKAVFTGYLFVHMAKAALPALYRLGIDELIGVLGTENGPTPIRDAEVIEVRRMVDDWTDEEAKPVDDVELVIRQKVLVRYGHYGTIAGRLEAYCKRKGRATIRLKLFGGEINADVPLDRIKAHC